MDAVLAALRELGLYVLALVAFFAPIGVFLRVRLRWVARRGLARTYVALADPWVTLVVGVAGAWTIGLLAVLAY
jgi:hypothetical protein